MPAAVAESLSRPQLDIRNLQPYRPPDPAGNVSDRVAFNSAAQRSLLEKYLGQALRKERQVRPENGDINAWIDYFDNNWQQEHLQKDWHHLKTQSSKKVGFIMDQQMNMLKDPYDKLELADWVQKTKRDLQGFKLEFLTDNVIYPRKYFRDKKDPSRLIDPFYGKGRDGVGNADIAEVVSTQERKGSVKASIQKIKKYFETAPDGSIAVMTSPKGETGFKTQDGLGIDYPDSYFFIMVKNGDEVMNYTLKTNFNLAACREVIYQLTGTMLPVDAPIEAYVSSLAFMEPKTHQKVRNLQDLVKVFQYVQPEHAFVDNQNGKVTKWYDVQAQIDQGEALYHFDKASNDVINDFETFGNRGDNSKERLEKGIAVVIYRSGEIFFQESEVANANNFMREGVSYEAKNLGKFMLVPRQSYGQILEQTAERRGCAGGGPVLTITTMGGQRVVIKAGGGGSLREDQYGSLEFKCQEGHPNTRPRGQLIPRCTTCGVNVAC